MKTAIYHLIVLDASGSMSSLKEGTINGCNETLQTVRRMQADNNDSQEHYVSINIFSGMHNKYFVDNKPIDDVKEITLDEYETMGLTPLYDALGDTLTDLGRRLVSNDSMAYVTIITDGEENSSDRYDHSQVVSLIDILKQRGVVFSFVGANICAADVALTLHITNSMQFTPTNEGAKEMWERERRSKRRSGARFAFLRKQMDAEQAARRAAALDNAGDYYADHTVSHRVTPGKIHSLRRGEVFVFGSNILGEHNGGAALAAVRHFGAVPGQPEGLQGRSYAIPTVGVNETYIYGAVRRFINFAIGHPEMTFLVTPVGCGTAGFSPRQIAPMFHDAVGVENIHLPAEFWKLL